MTATDEIKTKLYTKAEFMQLLSTTTKEICLYVNYKPRTEHNYWDCTFLTINKEEFENNFTLKKCENFEVNETDCALLIHIQ